MVKIVNNEIGHTGFGLMSFGFLSPAEVESKAFPAMRAAIDAGATFWNGGEFYGKIGGENSLTLLNRYFSKYPEDADKITLSIKAGMTPTMGVDASPKGIIEALDRCLQQLPPSVKKIDIFQAARVDPNVKIEDTISALAGAVNEGKIGGIGISEVSAQSVRRAAAVHKIAAVEVELSMFETRNIDNGVMAACAEFDIPLIAYSPLGQGFLAGRFKSRSDLAEGDPRLRMPRYSEENFPKNIELVNKVKELADKKGVTPAQLALAWVRSFGGRQGSPSVVLPLPGASTVERVKENFGKEVILTAEDAEGIDKLLKDLVVSGPRYPAQIAHLNEG